MTFELVTVRQVPAALAGDKASGPALPLKGKS